MNIKLAALPVLALSCLTLGQLASAQTVGKPSQDCDKMGPRTWKAGSFEERREQEAAYWGCRMGVSTETVKQWQRATDALDPIEGIKMGIVDKQELVFIQRMGGTMRCFSFNALKKTNTGWQEVWQEAADEYCMMKCPGIEMRIFGSRLILEIPTSSDADCKQMFQKKEFIWNGTTFRPAGNHPA